MAPKVAPYGSWKSPIGSDLVASRTIGSTPPKFVYGQIELDGEDVYWIEPRTSEGGRYVVIQRTSDGRTRDVTPPPFNVRTQVHEYGGGAFVVADGRVYFSNAADQRLHVQDPGSLPRPITPEAQFRYADGTIDPHRRRMICVREDHTVAGREAVNTLVSVDLEGDREGGKVLVSGNDFYSSPRLSPDGSRAAWITWNHPNMPWDGTELWVADLRADGSVQHARRVAGGSAESIFQPEWSPDGILHFVSDRTGWWNLYRWRDGRPEPLWNVEAEFGVPQWTFRLSTYAFESANRIVCTYTQHGIWHLASLNTDTLQVEMIEIPYSEVWNLRAAPGRAVFTAGSPSQPVSMVQLDLPTGQIEALPQPGDLGLDPRYLSIPEHIEFPTEGGLAAYGFYYAPTNPDYVAPSGERPPLLVTCHGGPTSATWITLRLDVQYWTSRGIAVLDVNYGGSTGYGREYRQRLNGEWGVVDLNDCVNGVRYLVERGEVDRNRLAVRGCSAGGYTVLCALAFRDIFHAGVSYFGITDLEMFAKDTHKFESRYLDGLIGPYPERADLYRARSPINSANRLSCPVILLQGLDDKVVPPNQAESMVSALRAKRLPVAYIAFAGEQHGFLRAENIKRALEAELYFLSKVFGLELPDSIEAVPIENLSQVRNAPSLKT